MEINEFVADKLKKASKNVSIDTLARIGDNVEVAVEKLIEAGNRGEFICTEFRGKKLHSFYSADTLYEQVFGKTKSEFLAKKKEESEMIEKDRQKDKQLCEQALKEKLPKWERVIRENFPSELAEKKIQSIKDGLENGNAIDIEHNDKFVAFLETLNTKSESEIKETYLGLYKSPYDRIFFTSSICNSYNADKFEPLLSDDIKEDSKTTPELMERRLAELNEAVQKAMKKKAEKEGSAPSQPGE